MHINGHRTHLGERTRVGGTRVTVHTLPSRPSPEPDAEIVWYPHKDAPSLLAPDVVARHGDVFQNRGSILALRSLPGERHGRVLPAWTGCE